MSDKMPDEIWAWKSELDGRQHWVRSSFKPSKNAVAFIRADLDAAKRKELADRLDEWYS